MSVSTQVRANKASSFFQLVGKAVVFGLAGAIVGGAARTLYGLCRGENLRNAMINGAVAGILGATAQPLLSKGKTPLETGLKAFMVGCVGASISCELFSFPPEAPMASRSLLIAYPLGAMTRSVLSRVFNRASRTDAPAP